MAKCACGCQEDTTVAGYTDRRKGWVKGQPLRFKHGHHARVMPAEVLARIQAQLHEGRPVTHIAAQFNLASSTVTDIKLGRRRRRLPGGG